MTRISKQLSQAVSQTVLKLQKRGKLPEFVQHAAYETCRVLDRDIEPEQQPARLAFYTAARKILAETLDLMGMTAPHRM